MTSTDNNDGFEPTGLTLPITTEPVDILDELSLAITNDILYGILHDLMLETHREAKTERAASAAAIVKQKALDEHPNLADEISAGIQHPKIETRTAGALYKDGAIYLTENPLKSTLQIICPKCGLPRLLHPTTGRGAKTPEPGVEYCKKRPFIDKDYYDVHGQTFVPKGPGRGRRKEDMIDPVMQQLKASLPNGSQDSDTSAQIPTQLKEPHAKCINCGSFQAASRMNKHMSKCIGGLSRESARNAKSKIFNGNDTSSQNGHTPPGSRNSTPALGAGSIKNSPGKRSAEEEPDESDEAPKRKKKRLIKRGHITKSKASQINVKKNGGQTLASNLSFENKLTDVEDDDVEGDDSRDINYGTKLTNKNKLTKSSTIKIENAVKPKPKILKRLAKSKRNSSQEQPSVEMRNSKSNSSESRNKSLTRHNRGGATPPTEESSQTMSSPNPE
ncbi:putative transcriptional activator [Erysiphe necator]|uniref:Putative transcriptional activator n=1 Tax=Uncinula necator TaxID=52586 RepID=A0A0B1PA02_UNCNE|nr:putative transcriptional activator [Erysiphe necator]